MDDNNVVTVETVNETPVEPKVEEVVSEPEEVSQETASEIEVDRSAFNCPDCAGEGLIRSLDKVCTTCNGTGKI